MRLSCQVEVNFFIHVRPLNDLYLHLSLLPDYLSVFNHPDNAERATVQAGSGYFELVAANGEVVNAKYSPSNQSIGVRPLIDGDTVVTVRDLCLASSGKKAKLSVTVSGVHSVDLVLTDKVQRGRAVSAQAKLVDKNGNEIGVGALRFMEVILSPEKDIVRIMPKEGSEKDELVYSIKGEN